MSPLTKYPPTAQRRTGKKGLGRTEYVIAYDAAGDFYYLASGEGADAYLVYDESDDVWTVDTTNSETRARVAGVGAAAARIIE